MSDPIRIVSAIAIGVGMTLAIVAPIAAMAIGRIEIAIERRNARWIASHFSSGRTSRARADRINQPARKPA